MPRKGRRNASGNKTDEAKQRRALKRAEEREARGSAGGEAGTLFHRVIRVDGEGRAPLQGLQSRRERTAGDRWREDAPGVEVGDRQAPWQGPVKTGAPSRAPTPPEEWQRQAGALDRYELLFTDEGAALEKALATFEGVTDHSDLTPRVCILARATKGAVAHADVFERQVAEEAGKGFVARRSKPFGVPTVGRGTNVIPKGEALEGQEQKHRCIVNRSDSNDVYVFDGKQFLPAAPNANTAKLELPDLRWASIQTVLEGGGIPADAAQRMGCVVIGGTYDLKDWSRQLAVRSTERWKGRYRPGGEWVDDRRLQMGGVAAASIAHRMGMLLAVLLLEDLGQALAELLLEEPERFAELVAWREERRAACPGVLGADRPYDLRNSQDDLPFQVVSELGEWAGGVIRTSLARWKVILSGKEKDLAVTFEAIHRWRVHIPARGREDRGAPPPRHATAAARGGGDGVGPRGGGDASRGGGTEQWGGAAIEAGPGGWPGIPQRNRGGGRAAGMVRGRGRRRSALLPPAAVPASAVRAQPTAGAARAAVGGRGVHGGADGHRTGAHTALHRGPGVGPPQGRGCERCLHGSGVGYCSGVHRSIWPMGGGDDCRLCGDSRPSSGRAGPRRDPRGALRGGGGRRGRGNRGQGRGGKPGGLSWHRSRRQSCW